MNRFRKWLAFRLAHLARRIYPESDEYKEFIMDVMIDNMIFGQSAVRVNPMDMRNELEDELIESMIKGPEKDEDERKRNVH